MRLAWIWLWAFALSCSTAQAQDFVRVRDAQFWLGGTPLRFVGANASVIHGPQERTHTEAVLDAVRADGLKVIRVWALGEQAAPGKPHHPLYAFRIGPDGWVDGSFVQLDRVLTAAKARDLKVIVVLANRWKDYGGIGMYADWAGVPMQRDLRGEPLATQLSRFYDCAPCSELYQSHVKRVVERVNSVSGVAYRDDPTILAWELINEASAITARDEETLLSWVQAQARFIRGLDPKHLISAGHIGYGSRRERAIWKRVQALPEVDFADAHAYPAGDPRVSSVARLQRWIDDRIAIAQELQKPLLFGEMGFERALSGKRTQLTRAFLSHAARAGAAGVLIWNYEPAANPRSNHSISEDPKDRDSSRLRAVLRAAAREFEAKPRAKALCTTQPCGPRFTFNETLRGSSNLARNWVDDADGSTLDIDPLGYARSSFERTGHYEEGPLALLWGVGEGFVEYRFVAPDKGPPPRSLVIQARLSSELPGFEPELDPRDGSDVEVQLDGEVLGVVRAMPDDGFGELVRIEWPETARLRRLLARTKRHSLRFIALPSSYAGGLCIYGKPTHNVPLDSAHARPVDHVRIQLFK